MRLAVRATALTAIAPCFAFALSNACGGNEFSSSAADAGPATNLDSGPGTDAQAEAAADAGTWCTREAGAHTFCDDFDGKPFLSNGWDAVQQSKGAAQDDSTNSVSPPNSFEGEAQTSTSALPAGIVTEGRLQKAFPVSSRIVVAFEAYLDSTPDSPKSGEVGGDSIIEVALGDVYTVGIYANSTTVGYFENLGLGDAGTNDAGNPAPSIGDTSDFTRTWKEVTFTVDIASQTLTLDAAGEPERVVPITPPSGAVPTLYLGAHTTNTPNGPLEAHYDNVTVDVTP